MKVLIASDHRGFNLKGVIINYLKEKKIEVIDLGTNSIENTDYTKYAFLLGEKISKKEADFGILICGSGIGMSIACNKVKGIRCAKCDNIKDAKYSRRDNDANVLALGDIAKYRAKDIIDVFLKTHFSDIDRYKNRVLQITEYEENN